MNMTEKKGKKYVLFKGEHGSSKPCAFFNLPGGCKNGSTCPFMHGSTPSQIALSPASSSSSVDSTTISLRERKNVSDASNLTEGSLSSSHATPKKERKSNKQTKPQSVTDSSGNSPKKHNSNRVQSAQQFSSASVIASLGLPVKEYNEPGNSSISQSTVVFTNGKKRSPSALNTPNGSKQVVKLKRRNSSEEADDDHAFLFGVVDHATKYGSTGNMNLDSPFLYKADSLQYDKKDQARVTQSTKSNLNSIQQVATGSVFLDSVESTKRLRTSGTKATRNLEDTRVNPTHNSFDRHEVDKSMHQTPVPVDLLEADWSSLVLKTQSNPRFQEEYNFHVDSTWITAKKAGAWSVNLPKILAIDCEMCVTEDPVTREKDKYALIRLSVINGFEPAQILIDTLVSPNMPIYDCKTDIHGISEGKLKSVEFSFRHAQAFLINICSSDTIIVGHGCHNDLKALRFNHTNVIDTSYLYGLLNEPHAAASIKDISEQALGVKIPDIHDSVLDSRTALQAAVHLLSNDKIAQIDRTSDFLLVHRLPEYCTEKHIEELFTSQTQIVPSRIEFLVGSGIGLEQPSLEKSNGMTKKCNVFFSSRKHADLAFETITGPNKPDKYQRPQKRIYLQNGGYSCVRR